MDPGQSNNTWEQPWYIAYHNSRRKSEVTIDDVDHANKCNYDMLTSPITTDHFHSRILALLAAQDPASNAACPTVPSLSHLDTNLSPGEVAPLLIAYTSSWIDTCSPDPLISGISLQVLKLEIAYAAFCGVENVVVAAPRWFPGLNGTYGDSGFARAIQESLALANHMHISISMPMVRYAATNQDLDIGDLSEHAREEFLPRHRNQTLEDIKQDAGSIVDMNDAFGTWDSWNTIRSVCNYSSRLSLVLCIPPAKVTSQFNDSVLTRVHCRWYSEPVRAISFQRNSFIEASQHGAPTLSVSIQSLVSRLIRVKFGPWFILQDVEPLPSSESISIDETGTIKVEGFKNKVFRFSENPTPAEALSASQNANDTVPWPFLHLEYLRYIQHRQPPRTVVETYGAGYQDYLQIPLQPLANNLESMTYEVFEKDPVKYELYEEAIRKALQDWKNKKLATSGPNGRVVVAVAGAGRGPLVTRALAASKQEKVPIDIWAVEKNPNAFVFLQRRNKAEWKNAVTLQKCDMRAWEGPWKPSSGLKNLQVESPINGSSTETSDDKIYYPVDILISELLGSFADNELSPECLDGILHLLAPQGISIPRSYTAVMTPIAAPKLHGDIITRTPWDPSASETPSVVFLHAIDYLCAADTSATGTNSSRHKNVIESPVTPHILEAWSFTHQPLRQKQQFPISNSHNSRFAQLSFNIDHRATCHGFGGYFESVLYPGIELSTHPVTMEKKSASMISWFPIFFPLKIPMYLPDNSVLNISIWRKTDDRKVWYEWLVEAWYKDVKLNDRFFRLGSSELHSSIKNGCLM